MRYHSSPQITRKKCKSTHVLRRGSRCNLNSTSAPPLTQQPQEERTFLPPRTDGSPDCTFTSRASATCLAAAVTPTCSCNRTYYHACRPGKIPTARSPWSRPSTQARGATEASPVPHPPLQTRSANQEAPEADGAALLPPHGLQTPPRPTQAQN